MEIKVKSEVRSLAEWKEILSAYQYEILVEMSQDDYGDNYIKYSYDSSEVLDYIVQYEGGIATAYHIKQLINTLYNIDLH